MFHALEHVPDPRRVLTTIRGWLKRGGHLVVEVPNVASTVQAPTHRYHYAHLYHFTASTLGALGEAAGLRLVETRHTEDGGNVIAVFRRDTDEKRPPEGLESAAAGTLATLQQHTELRHYLSLTPYRRAARRLARRLAEDRLLKTLGNVENALRWVADQRKSRLH